MSACISTTIRGGLTCWSGARLPPHAVSFDIDWELLPYRARGGVLLPILGSSYGKALENGEIELRYDADEGSFSAWYFEHRLPIAPERYGEILNMIVKEAGAEDSAAGKRILDLASRYHGLRHPNRKEAPGFKAELRDIEGARDIIERGLAAYRAGQDRPAQTQALHHLLERQHYKLGHWRLASSDINYRRFFDVNSLAGLRVEDAATFNVAHRLVRTVDRRRQVARIEARSHRRPSRSRTIFPAPEPPDPAGRRKSTRSFYIVVEKILGEHEDIAAVCRRRRHDRLRDAQHHHAGAGQSKRAGRARRDLAADQQHAARARACTESRQAARAGNAAHQRIHRAGAPARAHRGGPLFDARFLRRQSAPGA